jgi:hypothetical protein
MDFFSEHPDDVAARERELVVDVSEVQATRVKLVSLTWYPVKLVSLTWYRRSWYPVNLVPLVWYRLVGLYFYRFLPFECKNAKKTILMLSQLKMQKRFGVVKSRTTV